MASGRNNGDMMAVLLPIVHEMKEARAESDRRTREMDAWRREEETSKRRVAVLLEATARTLQEVDSW